MDFEEYKEIMQGCKLDLLYHESTGQSFEEHVKSTYENLGKFLSKEQAIAYGNSLTRLLTDVGMKQMQDRESNVKKASI